MKKIVIYTSVDYERKEIEIHEDIAKMDNLSKLKLARTLARENNIQYANDIYSAII